MTIVTSGKVWAGATALMVIPVIVLRAVNGEAWDLPGEAIFLAGLVSGVGIAFEVAKRIPDRLAYASGIGLAIWAALLQMWINLAVGIVGSEDNPVNLIYLGVTVFALLATIAARFRAEWMVSAMKATAVAQASTFVIALLAGGGFTGPITVFFTALWLIAAWLFRRAVGSSATTAVPV
ncbi:hypothetical protein SH584_07315 [Sphingomonas sp. LY29]|uniref:hypothetical protein n=1 Tax=Sphingomonas sp. LY29 TaxID=3095341 RepID=UPI002D76903A|nr:hypothetical protein [Sphingomonas sp. LY29]WRP24871.1 hypothetical protein SH584_07315 [Sphingomonas sp. LY29]